MVSRASHICRTTSGSNAWPERNPRIDMIALRKRRERNLSLSHRRPGFIGVFYAGDAANLLLKEPRRNPTKWHNPTRSNARHNGVLCAPTAHQGLLASVPVGVA